MEVNTILILIAVAYFPLIVAVLAFILAVLGKRKFYWISALGIYLFSFIAGFSIGQLTVGLTFIPLLLAIGFSFDWIKTKANYLWTAGSGILIGIIVVAFVDDRYTFFPFWLFVS